MLYYQELRLLLFLCLSSAYKLPEDHKLRGSVKIREGEVSLQWLESLGITERGIKGHLVWLSFECGSPMNCFSDAFLVTGSS